MHGIVEDLPDFVVFCIENGAEVEQINISRNRTSDMGVLPLERATYEQSPKIITALIKAGAKVTPKCIKTAVKSGNKSVIASLIARDDAYETVQTFPDWLSDGGHEYVKWDRAVEEDTRLSGSGDELFNTVAEWAWENNANDIFLRAVNLGVNPWQLHSVNNKHLIFAALEKDNEEILNSFIETATKENCGVLTESRRKELLETVINSDNRVFAEKLVQSGISAMSTGDVKGGIHVLLIESDMSDVLVSFINHMPTNIDWDSRSSRDRDVLSYLLSRASWEGNDDIVNALLRIQVPANETTRYTPNSVELDGYRNLSPIAIAVLGQHKDVIRTLLKAGANPNHLLSGGSEQFLANSNIRYYGGVIPDQYTPFEESRPILFEALRGTADTEIAELLLDFDSNLYAVGDGGMNVLHFVAAFGNLEGVQWLLDKGISNNATDQIDRSPIIYATMTGGVGSDEAREERAKIVRELIQTGISPETIFTDSRKTWIEPMPLLMFAIRVDAPLVVNELLKANKGLITIKNIFESPLQVASGLSSNSGNEIVRILLDAGANVDSDENISIPLLFHGEISRHQHYVLSPLSIAARTVNQPLVQLLVESGASLGSRFDKKAVQSFIQNQSDNGTRMVMQKDWEGSHGSATNWLSMAASIPLHHAIMVHNGAVSNPGYEHSRLKRKASIDMIDYLINQGSTIEQPYRQYGTPLDMAVSNNNFELAEYLLKKGANVSQFALNRAAQNRNMIALIEKYR